MVKKIDIIVELMKYEPCKWCKECNGINNCNIYKSYKYNYSRMKKEKLLEKLLKLKREKETIQYRNFQINGFTEFRQNNN